jgi:DNA-binding LytR/AlgR family response regulator
MNVLIVEDEINAFEYLSKILLSIAPEMNILDNLDSVKSTLDYLADPGRQIDLIFMDIQLSDGLSFEIFNHMEIDTPIIFTTAYDQYALEAFKVHSVDYLLKPIHRDDLSTAIEKYKKIYHGSSDADPQNKSIQNFINNLTKRKKNRCLVKRGGHFEYVDVETISYINSEESITFLHTVDGTRHIYGKTVEALMDELDPLRFFQINRSQILNINSIKEIHPYLNQRLKVLIHQNVKEGIDFVVSRNKLNDFKVWLDQ